MNPKLKSILTAIISFPFFFSLAVLFGDFQPEVTILDVIKHLVVWAVITAILGLALYLLNRD